MSDTSKDKLCTGCFNNFYNGNNPYEIKECWHRKAAKRVKRMRVGIWQRPPYVWHPVTTLSCHKPEGFAWVGIDDSRVVQPKQEPADA